jgi:SAM-dependent methyltransferase
VPEPGANAAVRARWNDDAWVADWPRKEQLTRLVTPALVAAANPRPGEAVLDIGCGSGATTLATARAVGHWGHVVGVDFSRPLVARARRLVSSFEEGIRARFVVADVQTDPVPGGPFDAAISQFGVMFFDDPVAALTAVAALLKPGGRVTFVAWREADRNPWNLGPVLLRAGVAEPPAPAAPGKATAGPFAWADPDHVCALMEGAGFTDVAARPRDQEATVPRGAVVGEDLALLGVPAERRAEAAALIERHVAPLDLGDGRLRVPLAYWLVTARRPASSRGLRGGA